jgi:hypothetical protein
MTRRPRRTLLCALALGLIGAATPLAAAAPGAFLLAPVKTMLEVKLATATIALETTAEGLLVRFSAAR